MAPVVVIMHGTGLYASLLRPLACGDEVPSWFLNRGYVVALPIRRGFGPTGGPVSELRVVKPRGDLSCDDYNYYLQAQEAARDIAVTVDYATALPFSQNTDAVVVGESTGGFITIGYDSMPHPKVSALINVSGGIGGMSGGNIGRVCHPERLVSAAGRFGATAQTPMLWIYATNDFLFSPDLARAMHGAFTQAGGKADLVITGVFGVSGHSLFLSGNGGSYLWGPPVERYLAQQRQQAVAAQ